MSKKSKSVKKVVKSVKPDIKKLLESFRKPVKK